MNTEVIGTWAGLVWNALNEKDVVVGLKQLKKETKLKDKEVFAAIGWLAREGKVDIQTNPDDEKDLLFALVQDK
ncbi:MAG: winged helix-turn-helix domain-containing protein [Muribaculaceae bacterium]|nr:winged helix-turn-helix domain-containing protein [Bacteroidales bacterium]MDY4811505.1 winged helix-turn-helix domain-containing protein [Muribaculaceae bacterium]